MAASNRPKRSSRKARRAGGGAVRVSTPVGAPRAVASQRREERAARAMQERELRRVNRTVGERPPSPFGGLPISETAILLGLISLVVGLVSGKPVAMVVGAIVCGLGVLEFSVREHFSGFRSHSTLLAAVPAVVVEALVAVFAGVPRQHLLILVPVIPVFVVCFWFLRRSFQTARQARVARPPAP